MSSKEREAEAGTAPDPLRATEKWFIRRGLPMFVEDYSAGRDVWTRALPALATLFVLELFAVTYRAEMNGDEMATPFQTITTRSVSFADGYLDPALIPNGMQETISVFNPYASNVNFLYDLYFTFADGTRLPAAAPGVFSLGSHERADHRPQDFANILAKINSNPAFRFYSVEVVSTQFTLPQPVGGVIAQLTRVHNTWGQNLTTIPNLDPRLVVMFLDNPEFHP